MSDEKQHNKMILSKNIFQYMVGMVDLIGGGEFSLSWYCLHGLHGPHSPSSIDSIVFIITTYLFYVAGENEENYDPHAHRKVPKPTT